MIEGLKPYFTVGPPQAPVSVSGDVSVAPTADRSAAAQSVTPVERVAAPRPSRPLLAEDTAAGEAQPTPSVQSEKSDPAYKEPTLPKLSAEALATALMTAEPDKAVVPRVLPAEPAETGS